MRALELLKDHGPTEVCRILGLPMTRKSTLSGWKNGKHKPPTVRWHPEPNNELAYVLGVLSGDGCVVNEHGYHYDIELKVKDHEFAEVLSKNMAKLLNKKYKEPRWRIYYRSKAFYTWYKAQELETLKPYIEHDEETVASFLCGLYDSDGGYYKYTYSYGEFEKICLFNNDTDLLRYVQYLLEKYFDIIATGPYRRRFAGKISIKRNGEEIKTNHDNYYIAISRKQHVARFLEEIGFSIREKQLGLPRRRN